MKNFANLFIANHLDIIVTMPKRKEEDDLQWTEDSDIYLPDQSLKSAFYNPNAHIVYRNGEIVVENADENVVKEPIDLSRDYKIAKVYLALKDFARDQALPLLDKPRANAGDLEHFLSRFL